MKLPREILKSADDPFWALSETCGEYEHLTSIEAWGGTTFVFGLADPDILIIDSLSEIMRPRKNSRFLDFEELTVQRLQDIETSHEKTMGLTAPLTLHANHDGEILYIVGENDMHEMRELRCPYVSLSGENHEFFLINVLAFRDALIKSA